MSLINRHGLTTRTAGTKGLEEIGSCEVALQCNGRLASKRNIGIAQDFNFSLPHQPNRALPDMFLGVNLLKDITGKDDVMLVGGEAAAALSTGCDYLSTSRYIVWLLIGLLAS